MKKSICLCAALCALSGTAVAGEVFNQGFESDTAGWSDGGSYGTVTRVMGAAASGSYYANITQSDYGSYTFFDGSRDTWSGPYKASAAIYLDTGWADGEGFDYSVASNDSSGNHLQDFIFHVTKDSSTGDLLVGGSNNTDFDPQEGLESGNHAVIGASGWYTFEHSFYDNGDGTLAVAMNLYNSSGTLIFTEIRNTPANILATVVGGNRYGWFTNIDIGGGINVDDVTLTVVPLPPAVLASLGLLAGCAGVRQYRRR